MKVRPKDVEDFWNNCHLLYNAIKYTRYVMMLPYLSMLLDAGKKLDQVIHTDETLFTTKKVPTMI